jgi:predicted transcriptional regulator
MASRKPRSDGQGLPGLRRGGTLAELLLLYDFATEEPTRLRPIADRLGVSVQAVSHSYRQLAARGLAELRGGRYVPTVEGVAWLHRMLRSVSDDAFTRQQRLAIVRSCRAIARRDLAPGEPVALELVDGLLSAVPGRSSGSRGRATTAARAGELVTVGELEGILPIPPAGVRILTLPSSELAKPGLGARLARALTPPPTGIVGASGLGAIHLLGEVHKGPFLRFAAGAAAADAVRVGVPATIVVLDEDLPGLVRELEAAGRPPITVQPIDRPLPRATGRQPA